MDGFEELEELIEKMEVGSLDTCRNVCVETLLSLGMNKEQVSVLIDGRPADLRRHRASFLDLEPHRQQFNHVNKLPDTELTTTCRKFFWQQSNYVNKLPKWLRYSIYAKKAFASSLAYRWLNEGKLEKVKRLLEYEDRLVGIGTAIGIEAYGLDSLQVTEKEKARIWMRCRLLLGDGCKIVVTEKEILFLIESLEDYRHAMENYNARMKYNTKDGPSLSSKELLAGTATHVLKIAAKKGTDISSAITILTNLLEYMLKLEKELAKEELILPHPFTFFKDATEALAHHYANKEKWNKIEELVEHHDQSVRYYTGHAFTVNYYPSNDKPSNPSFSKIPETEEGTRIKIKAFLSCANNGCFYGEIEKVVEMGERALPFIIRLSKSRFPEIRSNAFEVFRSASKKGMDISSAIYTLVSVLGKERSHWRETDFAGLAVDALRNLVEKRDSVEKLRETQKIIKSCFRKWMSSQSEGISNEKVHAQFEVSKLLLFISNKEKEIAKNMGGELLHKESVKPPKKESGKIKAPGIKQKIKR